MMGLENWTDKGRILRLSEYVELVDRLLSNEVSSYKGTYCKTKDAVMLPRPLESPRCARS
jgi:alkanesulfonate monooxygenase SsuD/methylene tetrahydromethanopterin reductase-like flavin-dependent oxidoreductase (luciferase family)